MKRLHLIFPVFSVTLVAVAAAAARDVQKPYVISRGSKIPGSDVHVAEDGEITLITPEGRMIFDPGTTVVVEEPAVFPELRRMVEEGKYEEAISGLREIVDQYRFLQWDHRARIFLGRAQTGVGRHREAVETLEELFAAHSGIRSDPTVQATYLSAMQGVGDRERLMPLIEEFVRGGERQVAALAQMIRGNLLLEDGELEKALYDFQRTALLFGAEKDVHAEALYRTAYCFERLGKSAKARYYQGLLETAYPDSEYAERVRRD